MTSAGTSIRFGNYLLSQKLAHGGMAEVFIGTEGGARGGGRKIVVKRILPELARDPRFVAMFINEAQLAGQMDHPNLVRVLDFGDIDGQLYMVMEHVDGLDCWKLSRRMFPWGEEHEALAIYIVMSALAGLDYAHQLTDVNGKALSVVHRDLSPSNIYISAKGEVKVGDFGIARIDSVRYRPVEVTPKGKFGYMAPEQVEGRPIDRRADVYSAGVVLAELLIGQKIFSGNSQLGVLLDIRDGRMDALENNLDKVPPALLKVLRGALSRKPMVRFPTARDFRDALACYLEAKGKAPTASDLAAQVRLALELRSPLSSDPSLGRPRTPRTGEPLLERTPHAAELLADETTRAVGLARSSAEHPGTPVTAESDHTGTSGRYSAKLAGGFVVGPTSYAHVIELIYSDRIDASTLVSADGREYLPAGEIPELMRHLPAYTPTSEAQDAVAPDRRGYLEMEVPSVVLLSLAVRGETGLLVCQRESRRKEVYLHEGSPQYVGSNNPTELLGECLVRDGVIDRMELEMALALLPKFSGHMGDTLIALGMLSAVDLYAHINNQIRSRLADLLTWQDGYYEFYRGVKCRPGVLEVKIDPYEFIREKLLADMQHVDFARLLDEMRSCLVAPAPLLQQLCERLALPSEIDEKVKSVGDWLSIRELEAAAGRSQLLLARAIFVALEAGLWTFDGPVPPWRREKKDPPAE
ncbi:MAG: protein kinase [Proteobacteria bacterium]|jgi:serine/threonine-protein kinase|nr:protein kinase [Pseudomonadota bacterium]